jgi:ATP-dependent exoDNAse (exonuclease V) alpha subunit
MDANKIRQNTGFLQGHEGFDRPRDRNLRWSDDDNRIKGVISDFEQKKGFSMSDGQKEAVALALSSSDRHIGIVGAAGAGKTTSMELIVQQYRAAGYEIVGVAPSAAAASELKSAGCDDTRTLASAILAKQEQDEEGQKKQKLYILDEAGMVSARDMDAFLRKADAENARTILVGDPLQLSAVEAGSPYAQMLKTGAIRHANIDEIQRQKDPRLREIAQAFAGGDAARGVELAKPYMRQIQPQAQDYAAAGLEDGATTTRGRVPAEARRAALARAAAEAYLALSPDERARTLMLASTNQTRREINRRVREGLETEGVLRGAEIQINALDKLDITREAATRAEKYRAKNADSRVIVALSQDIKDKSGNIEARRGSIWYVADNSRGKLTLRSLDAMDQREISIDPAKTKLKAYEERKIALKIGDQIIFRENDRERGILNGTRARIVSTDQRGVIAETEGGERVKLKSAESIDYAYARTVHSSQGATVDRAIVVGESSGASMAESAYVACSRERIGLQIITDDPERLSKSWGKFAEKRFALDAALDRARAPESLAEINKARRAADLEAGRHGDLQKAAGQQRGRTEQDGRTSRDEAGQQERSGPDRSNAPEPLQTQTGNDNRQASDENEPFIVRDEYYWQHQKSEGSHRLDMDFER